MIFPIWLGIELKMNQEVSEKEIKDLMDEDSNVFDLENSEDREGLQSELKSNSIYFQPEKDVTYKVTLTSPSVTAVDKEFDGDHIRKYAINIRAEDKTGNVFEGIWETGKTVIDPIVKNYSKDAVFKITKTGTGKDTRYSVVADF